MIQPGKYSEEELFRWHSEWMEWKTTENLPQVLVSPLLPGSQRRYPNPQFKYRVLLQQWMSSCPVDIKQISRFRRAGCFTGELDEFLKWKMDTCMFGFRRKSVPPNRTQPVQLHRMGVIRKLLAIHSRCTEYDEKVVGD